MVLNGILALGIVLTVLACVKLRRMNQELHSENQRSRLAAPE